ncbi:hypothetical protein DY000_02025413 [Brassica cretica]|uniref:Uncharacterized protein n=1 Tax=Brassica cretica TaxID=69181 RepID=A0ABQ7EAP8_BRACR|nr:hypothetical protein DY000_02025413 [Brassica cretica]
MHKDPRKHSNKKRNSKSGRFDFWESVISLHRRRQLWVPRIGGSASIGSSVFVFGKR